MYKTHAHHTYNFKNCFAVHNLITFFSWILKFLLDAVIVWCFSFHLFWSSNLHHHQCSVISFSLLDHFFIVIPSHYWMFSSSASTSTFIILLHVATFPKQPFRARAFPLPLSSLFSLSNPYPDIRNPDHEVQYPWPRLRSRAAFGRPWRWTAISGGLWPAPGGGFGLWLEIDFGST